MKNECEKFSLKKCKFMKTHCFVKRCKTMMFYEEAKNDGS
jgi:hypothetical protein